jgi:hypothetical protein
MFFRQKIVKQEKLLFIVSSLWHESSTEGCSSTKMPTPTLALIRHVVVHQNFQYVDSKLFSEI